MKGDLMNNPLRILLVDDNPDDRALVMRELRREFPDTHIEQIAAPDTLAQALAAGEFDLVITDYQLRWTDGLDVLRAVKNCCPYRPVIMFTATGSEEIAVEAMKAGLDDYVLKSPKHFARLPAAVQRALEQSRQRQALKEAESRYQRLFERVPVGLYRVSPDGQILDANPALAEMLGYEDRAALLDANAADFYTSPEARRKWKAMAAREGVIRDMEAQARRRDGTVIWVRHSSRLVRDDRGQLLYFEGAVEDITERKKREHELEAIVRVATALRSAPTRAEMLPVVLGQLADLFEAEGAAVAVQDPVTREMVIELGQGVWVGWTGTRLAPGEGISGQVIATGRPYVTPEAGSDPNAIKLGRFQGLSAVACVPLVAHAQVIGALWVGRQAPVLEEELRILTAVADMAANAIRRATLHEETKRRLQRLAALRTIDVAITSSLDMDVTFSILLEQLTNQLNIHAADILLLNPHIQTLQFAAGRGFHTHRMEETELRLGEGLPSRAALERELIYIPDLRKSENTSRRAPLLATEGFVTYYAAPLIARGQVKGVLELFHRRPLEPDPEWPDFLEAVAAQAAIAVDNVMLFNQLQRSNVELTLAYDTTLEGWARALELRDQETEGHSRRVTEMTLTLAQAMGMTDEELVHVRRGALLHDIGKMGIPDSILFKPGELTEEEWAVVRQHPVFARQMLVSIPFLRPALHIPYCHHERWDGTGYPQGLKGEQIPLAARIFAVVDVYDALCSDRPYRRAWPEEKARAYIQEQAGKQFDPRVVELFLKLLHNGSLT